MKYFSLLFFLILLLNLSLTGQNSLKSDNKISVSDISGEVTIDKVISDIIDETDTFNENDFFNNPDKIIYISTVENTEIFSDVNIYPNFTNSIVNVDISKNYKYLDIHFYNTEGALILNKRKAAGPNTIDISRFATGIYYMQLLNPLNSDVKTYKVYKK